LQKRGRRPAVWAIDFNQLFQSDHRGVLHDIKHGKCSEIGIVSAFPEFYSGARARAKLLKKYQNAYLAQWARIRRKRQVLEGLIAEQHGRRSLEYKIFRESLATNPRLEFRAQKAALIRAVAKEARSAKSNKNKPYHLIGHGLHGRVYKLSSQCCLKVFRSGKHAEIERRAYEAARDCRFVPKLYEAGPNYIIIEYIRGETLKAHLQRTGRVSAALTTQILSLFRELKRIGFTWTNFAIRHYLLTTEGQLKVIDLKNAYDQPNDVPHMLMKSLSRMGLREDFLRRVDKIDRSLGAKWRRAITEKNPALALPDLRPASTVKKGTQAKRCLENSGLSFTQSNPQRFFTHDRLDLVVKYRLFDMLLRGRVLPDVEEMYTRHILSRTGGVEPGNRAKTSLALYVTDARLLFQRMREIGFDPCAPIPVDQWGRLRDGAHRVACAAVLGLKVEVLYLKVQYPIRQWGVDWFLANGFSRK
jgi:predicted Ser/Thr protein kinase